MKKKNRVFWAAAFVLCVAIASSLVWLGLRVYAEEKQNEYIKWVEYDVPYAAMEQALKADISAYETGESRSWVDLLAYLAAQYGGDWSRYQSADMQALLEKLDAGTTMEELTDTMDYYAYYVEAYDAVLGGMVGEFYLAKETDASGQPLYTAQYGLKAYSPIAYQYGFSHYDDFGNSRSFGYRRRHLGNDLLGNVGTPIVAVESGTVEVMGWNRYGGWRIGVRSFDQKRYYYYAHLRKDHPFQSTLQEGSVVQAGDVIGYLGMTGYSDTENVNGMTKPHLHFGLQLIFDESQKEGNGEIWVDVYQLVNLLQTHCSVVEQDETTKEYQRKYSFLDPEVPGQDLPELSPQSPVPES